MIFILTTLRSFFGGLLHLVDEQLLKTDGRVWFTNFAFVAFEMLILIFFGGVTSGEATVHVRIGFVDYLIILLSIDIIWVVVIQWLSGKVSATWKCPDLWKWAQLNLSLGLILYLVRTLSPDPYGSLALTVVTVLNFVVFTLDVFWADYYVLIRESSKLALLSAIPVFFRPKTLESLSAVATTCEGLAMPAGASPSFHTCMWKP